MLLCLNQCPHLILRLASGVVWGMLGLTMVVVIVDFDIPKPLAEPIAVAGNLKICWRTCRPMALLLSLGLMLMVLLEHKA